MIQSLTDVSRMGMNIIMVIHQPRYSLFSLFDDVLLLAVGGEAVYLGPSLQALSYFESLGFTCPPMENPADFFLDVISGNVSLPDHPDFEPSDLPQFWVNSGPPMPDYFRTKDAAEIEPKSESSSLSAKLLELDEDATMSQKITSMVFGKTKKKVKDKEPMESPRNIVSTMKLPRVSDFHLEEKQLESIGILPNHLASLRKVFRAYDKDNDGTIDHSEVVALFQSLGKNLNAEEVSHFFHELGVRDHGRILISDILERIVAAQKKSAMRKHAPRPEELHLDPPTQRITPTIFRQFSLYFFREAGKMVRNYLRILFDASILSCGGLIIGILFGSAFTVGDLPRISLFGILSLGILSSTYSLRWFSEDRINYWREMSAGASRPAYILAKVLVQMFDTLFHPLVFSLFFYGIIRPEILYKDFYLIWMLAYFAASGMSMFYSCVVPPAKALLVAVLAPLILGGFLSGVDPPLSTLGKAGEIAASISFARWAAEAFLIKEHDATPPEARLPISKIFERTGFSLDAYSKDVLALFFIGIIFRILCWPALKYRNRGKQI